MYVTCYRSEFALIPEIEIFHLFGKSNRK